ncbi:Hypothetical protein POVR1_LOCUS433 [uncultured virus]|nr:Hypothetical protein POVR1_LOCUS433 [uncultured virus]
MVNFRSEIKLFLFSRLKMNGPQLMIFQWEGLKSECWYHRATMQNSLLHSTLSAFYMPYRLGDPYRLVSSIQSELQSDHDVMTRQARHHNLFADEQIVMTVATAFEKIIYVFSEHLNQLNVYNRENGTGCICLYQTLDSRYHLIGTFRNNDVKTYFGINDDLIKEIDHLGPRSPR